MRKINREGLERSKKMRENAGLIPEESFKIRKEFFCKKETGFLCKKIETNAMDALTKGNMTETMIKSMMSSNILSIGFFFGLGSLFSGFILAKMPFGLPHKFRSLTQQGFHLPELDVTYVSSMSWLILLTYGLHGVFKILMEEDSEAMHLAMVPGSKQMMGMEQQGYVNYAELFPVEKDNYFVLNYDDQVVKSERNLIMKYKEMVTAKE